jgi:cobalt-zinc-cadmium efflux system membrane fusion protein
MKLLLLALLLLPLGCKREAPTTEQHERPSGATSAEHVDEPKHEALPRKVKLTDAVIRDAKVQLAPASREVLSETLALPGEVAADPDHLARISSPAAGRIEEVRFKEGAFVKKGDVLAIVRVPEIGKVRSAFVATESRAAAARANAERLNDLFTKRLAAEQEALNATAEADALEVEARSLKDQLGALGGGTSGVFAISLRAPISGTVLARDAVVGQPV